jgi:hypothetical protein
LSVSLSKIIRVDIISEASSARYNLVFLKRKPIRYAEPRLIDACTQEIHKNLEQKIKREKTRPDIVQIPQ